jgi:tetratricopeptide (TPR) repeat protein
VDPGAAASLLRDAIGLWRGPPLAEFADEPFARVERARLEELRLVAIEERIDAELALGRHPDLAAELEALVREHPHRERFRRQLMVALYRCGRQADALETYRTGREALDELGLETSGALRALERQILTQDPALDLAQQAGGGTAPLPPQLVPEPRFSLVGRARELAELGSLLDRTVAGEGRTVLLGGEAGGGKTRLLRELAHEAVAKGALVAYGSADPIVRTPYQPVREWFEFIARTCDPDLIRTSLGPSGHLLARLVPAFASFAAVTDEPVNDPYLLQGAAIDLLTGLAGSRPLVLIADDIHWADGETLHLLRRLGRSAPGCRLLLVVSYRDRGEDGTPELAQTLTDLSRLDGVVTASLGRLSRDDVEAFVRDAAQVEGASSLAATLDELSDGTPLMLCELWRDLAESDAIEIANGVATLARPVAEIRSPERIRDIVKNRVARLDASTVSVLELAAVCGSHFDVRLLAEAAETERASITAAVDEAAAAGMIEELPGPGQTCRYTHELVRRAIYDGITKARRAELHMRIGQALEQLHGADPEPVIADLAHHFTEALSLTGRERAVEYNLRASAAAVSAAAIEDGRAKLATAIGLGIADPQQEKRAQIELAYLLREGGHTAESDAVLAGLVGNATGLEQLAETERRFVFNAGRALGDPRADPLEMRQAAEKALAAFASVDDPVGLSPAYRLLGLSYRRQGRLIAGLPAMERALQVAEAQREPAHRRRAVGSVAYALCDGPTPVAAGIARCEDLLGSSGGDQVFEAFVLLCLSCLLAMAGRRDEACSRIERGSRIFEQIDRLSTAWVYRIVAAETRELIGDVEGAERDLSGKWNFFRNFGMFEPDARAIHAASQLALLYCDEGRWDEAEVCTDYGREAPFVDYFLHENVLRLAACARVAGHRGSADESARLARMAVASAEQSDFLNLRARAWLALAEVRDRRGDSHEAAAARRAATTLYEVKGNLAALAHLR